MSTVALVAAKDAAASIAATVAALTAMPEIAEVWVVDDGSTDDTAARAVGAGARVVRLEANRGKGGALAVGVDAAPAADRYLLADADLADTARGLQALFGVPDAELIVGVLPSAAGRGGFGTVKKLAAAGIHRACGVRLAAPISGQRLVDGPLLRSLELAPRFGVEVAMTIDAARRGARIAEVPVDVDHRHTGRSLAGFRHRARQGYDIVQALAPRLTTERGRTYAVAAAALAVLVLLSALSVVTSPGSGAAFVPADRVVLFAFDRLRVADLDRADLPGLRRVASAGVAGALSVRTTDRRSVARRGGPERPSLIDAYASLGASARVRGVDGLAQRPGAARSAMDQARRLARRDRALSQPGALGDSLRAAGKRTALVAGPQFSGDDRRGYPAAAAIADRDGRIDHVEVSRDLLDSPGADGRPGRAVTTRFVDAASTALRTADVVLVDPGETARAAHEGAERTAALHRTDAILADLAAALPPATRLIVFAPTPPDAAWELTPLVVGGVPPTSGVVLSSSTRRAGVAVLTDLAPTVLHAVGADRPAAMTGAAVRHAGGELDIDGLERVTRDGAVRERFFLGVGVGYTVAALAFYLILAAALAAGRGRRWRTGLRLGACAVAALPLGLLAVAALQHWLGAGGESPLALTAVCVVLGTVAARWPGLRPVTVFAALTGGIVALDVAATGPLHTASVLGYSLQTSGRLYGLPNASFAVFASGLLFLAAAAAGGLRPPTRVRAHAGAAVLAVGAFFVAAPWLGNDVGGTLALVPVGSVVLWSFYRPEVTLRLAAVAGVAMVAALGLLLGVGAIAGGGSHLGRAIDGGSLANTLAHRAQVNLGLLLDQWWGFFVLSAAAAGVVAAIRGAATTELPAGSPLRHAVTAALALSLTAFVTNDSGPVVSVLCLVVAAPAVALRAIDVDPRRQPGR